VLEAGAPDDVRDVEDLAVIERQLEGLGDREGSEKPCK
jgi:hypothetical protein